MTDELKDLAGRAFLALLVTTASAGGADDDHATALAAVLVGGHLEWLRLRLRLYLVRLFEDEECCLCMLSQLKFSEYSPDSKVR